MNKSGLYIFMMMIVLGPAVQADSSTANRQTVFNNTTDFVATLGQNPQEKKEILKDRREIRREARLKNEARRKREAMRKQMKVQEEIIMRKVR